MSDKVPTEGIARQFKPFTASRERPDKHGPLGPLDSPLSDALGYYTDTRGNGWFVNWNGNGWTARPLESAATAYAITSGELRSWAIAASDAEMLIDGIEERVEVRRIENRDASNAKGWWLLALLVLLASSKGGRR